MMTNRHAAEQFEQLLIAGTAPDSMSWDGRRTAELVGVATRIRFLPGPALDPSPGFRVSLRSRLDEDAARLSTAWAALPRQRPS